VVLNIGGSGVGGFGIYDSYPYFETERDTTEKYKINP